MKPIEQTVYFLKEDVNLEENYYIQDLNGEFYLEQKGYFFTTEQLNEYTETVIKEALLVASEKSLLSIDGIVEKSNGQGYIVVEGNHYSETEIDIDKTSILSTFEETFNKFKV